MHNSKLISVQQHQIHAISWLYRFGHLLPLHYLLAHPTPRKRWTKGNLRKEKDPSPCYELRNVAKIFKKKIFFQLGFRRSLIFFKIRLMSMLVKVWQALLTFVFVKPQVLR